MDNLEAALAELISVTEGPAMGLPWVPADFVSDTTGEAFATVVATVLNAVLAGDLVPKALLDAMISRAREVKPLVWEDFGGFGAKASGFYQANYLIQKWSGESRYEVAMSYPGYQTGYDGPRWHPTLDAAKAAAQADYEARIRAALIPRPAEPAPADVAAQLAKLRETFCLASPGSDEGFTAWLEGFDAAVAIISATQEART